MTDRQASQPKKTPRCNFRFSTWEEKAAFEANAKASPEKSVSGYIKWLDAEFSEWLKAGKVPANIIRRSESQDLTPFELDTLRQLQGAMTNLNQIAHRCNIDEIHVPEEVILSAITEAKEAMERVCTNVR